MKTYMANPDKIERKWYVVDAEGCTLGRLASLTRLKENGMWLTLKAAH